MNINLFKDYYNLTRRKTILHNSRNIYVYEVNYITKSTKRQNIKKIAKENNYVEYIKPSELTELKDSLEQNIITDKELKEENTSIDKQFVKEVAQVSENVVKEECALLPLPLEKKNQPDCNTIEKALSVNVQKPTKNSEKNNRVYGNSSFDSVVKVDILNSGTTPFLFQAGNLKNGIGVGQILECTKF